MKDVTKKKFSVGVLVVAMLVLCLALMGCSSGGSSSGSSNNSSSNSSATTIPDNMINWVGSWVSKSEIVPGQGEVESGDYTITFNIDNTFIVDDKGVALYEGTWEPTEGVNGEATTDDGKAIRLELAANNTKLIFDGSASGEKKIICVR